MSTEREIKQWDEFYSKFGRLMQIPDIRLVRELSVIEPEGKAALVLGCGNGRHAIWLRKRGWHVVAVDYSATALMKVREWAQREELNDHILTQDLDLKDPRRSFLEEFEGKFDLVLAWDVLDYLNDDEIHDLLDWLPGLCVDGAKLIIWVRGEKDRRHSPLFKSSDGFMNVEKRNQNEWRFIFRLNPNWNAPVVDERWETFGMFNEHYYLVRSWLN